VAPDHLETIAGASQSLVHAISPLLNDLVLAIDDGGEVDAHVSNVNAEARARPRTADRAFANAPSPLHKGSGRG